jgi:hypothetical protein
MLHCSNEYCMSEKRNAMTGSGEFFIRPSPGVASGSLAAA